MAPLPRYDDIGIRIAPAAPMNTAAAEAAARAGSTISENLNRLSTFAFEQAAKQAAVEGLDIGVANAPTLEQLKAAHEAGEPAPIPGNTSTVFGRAVREGALAAVAKTVEIDARSKIAALEIEAKTQELAPSEFQKRLQDVIDGYGSSIAKVSPTAAFNMRAALATSANTQYLAYANWHLERERARQKIQFTAGIDGIIGEAEKIVAAGDVVSQSETPGMERVTTQEQLLANARTKILTYAAAARDPELAKTKLKEFNEKVDKAKVNYVAAWTQGANGVPTQAKYLQFMTGQFDPPTTGDPDEDMRAMNVKRMWDRMPLELRTKTQDEIRRQMKASLELDSSIDAASERQRREARDTNRVDFVKAWEQGDTAAQETALKRMEDLRDAEGREKYGKLIGEARTFTEPGLLFRLDQELARGTLTQERVVTLVSERKLSDTDARAYLPKIDASQDGEFREALQSVKSQLGYPDRPLINPSAAQRKAEQQVQAIQADMLAAKREAQLAGKPFNAWDFAQRRVQEVRTVGASQEELNVAERSLVGLRKQLGLPEEAPLDLVRTTLSQRVQAGSFNNIQAEAYYAQIRLMQEQGPR